MPSIEVLDVGVIKTSPKIESPVERKVLVPSWHDKHDIDSWRSGATGMSHFDYFFHHCAGDGADLRSAIQIPGRRGWEERVRQIFKSFVHTSAQKIAFEEQPDVVINKDYDENGPPYLRRWNLLPRNKFCNAYLHEFLRSDYDRALHDHPWRSLAFVLEGEGIEHVSSYGDMGTTHGSRPIGPGMIFNRSLTYTHRIEVTKPPIVTIFITGPTMREWGFWTEEGWVAARDMFKKVTEEYQSGES